MRRIIEYCLVSADGIILDDPFPFRDYYDEAYLQDSLALFNACDAMLCGRTTYKRFAKIYGGGGGGKNPAYAARLNAIQKYVFSSQLETAEWNNSTIVRGDVAAEVTKLKQQNGGDFFILGHGLLGETLLRQRLLDVLNFGIHPVLVDGGKPFFREGHAVRLRLAATKSFSKIVKITYEPHY
jgi:dihydrofolate reductase